MARKKKKSQRSRGRNQNASRSNSAAARDPTDWPDWSIDGLQNATGAAVAKSSPKDDDEWPSNKWRTKKLAEEIVKLMPLKAAELKRQLQELSVPYLHCLEKRELVSTLAEARVGLMHKEMERRREIERVDNDVSSDESMPGLVADGKGVRGGKGDYNDSDSDSDGSMPALLGKGSKGQSTNARFGTVMDESSDDETMPSLQPRGRSQPVVSAGRSADDDDDDDDDIPDLLAPNDSSSDDDDSEEGMPPLSTVDGSKRNRRRRMSDSDSSSDDPDTTNNIGTMYGRRRQGVPAEDVSDDDDDEYFPGQDSDDDSDDSAYRAGPLISNARSPTGFRPGSKNRISPSQHRAAEMRRAEERRRAEDRRQAKFLEDERTIKEVQAEQRIRDEVVRKEKEAERRKQVELQVKRAKDKEFAKVAYDWISAKLKGGSMRSDLIDWGMQYGNSIDNIVGRFLQNLDESAWVSVDESITAPVYKSLFRRDVEELADGTKAVIKKKGGHLLQVICRSQRKKDTEALVKSGTIVMTAPLLRAILSEFPKGPGNDFSNVFVKTLNNVQLEKKSDFSAILEAGNDKLSKSGWKKLKDVLKKGDSALKKKSKKPAAVVSIPSEPKPQAGHNDENVENMATGMTSPRQSKREDAAITKIREQFHGKIQMLLRWYEVNLEEYKARDVVAYLESSGAAKIGKDEATSEVDKKLNKASKQAKVLVGKTLTSEEIAMEMERCVALKDEEKQDEVIEQLEGKVDITNWGDESEWTVDITDQACKWFQRRSKKHYHFCERVISRLKLLSTGRWPYVLCKKLVTRNSSITLYESKIDKASRIIWEVATSFSPRRSSAAQAYCEQVIRVWDIVEDHDNLTRKIDLAVERIEKSHTRGEKCILYSELEPAVTSKALSQQGGGSGQLCRVPQVFPIRDYKLQDNNRSGNTSSSPTCKRVKHFPPANDDEQQYNLLKFYELNAGAVKVLLAENDKNVDLPFVPGPLEHEIIHYKSKPQRSILLMGRSGTGKTTCLVFRMWAMHMAYMKDTSKQQQPRLLFMTKNEVLRNEVERSFQNMGLAWQKRSLEDGALVAEREESKNPDPLAGSNPAVGGGNEFNFPMFLTTSEWLDLLDRELPGERFFSEAEAKARADRKDDSVMRSMDTFFEAVTEQVDNTKEGFVREEMTYDEFRNLWPKINSKHQANLDPALVWLEIKSYIKGSVAALRTNGRGTKRFLTLEEYLALPRKQSRIDESQRRVVYALYESYEKLKRHRHHYDEMDLVFNLAGRLDGIGPSSRTSLLPIDAVFVDEVQDFTQAELLILTKLSSSPNNLMLAGDTAQSIAVGVGFRFTDVRQIFYDSFGGIEPHLLQLNHNYRSHSGILMLAGSVVELLYHFFRDSLDKLPPDMGLFPGPKPVIMEASSPDEFMYMIEGSKRETSRIEFGSNQVVIVRNAKSKKTLLEKFDIDSDWVMTVGETKGLEFNDVLLYNFFTDSDAKKTWRVVSNYTVDDIADYHDSTSGSATGVQSYRWDEVDLQPTRPLEFNLEQHKVLETELKMLYTAVTRARVNLFVVETKKSVSRPMFNYFQSRALVEVIDGKTRESGSRDRIFGKMSTKEEWKERGEYYLQHAEGQRRDNCLRLAAKCFEKAGDTKRKEYTLAYLAYAGIEDTEMHSSGKSQPDKRSKEQIERLYKIGCQLLEAHDVAFLNKAAWCLVQTGEMEFARSAHLFEVYARISYAKRLQEMRTRSENYGSPSSHEQRYFAFAAKLYRSCVTQEISTPIDKPKHIFCAVRNYLSSGTRGDVQAAEQIVRQYPDECRNVAKDLLVVCGVVEVREEQWHDPTAFFRRDPRPDARGLVDAIEKTLSPFDST